MTKIGTLLFAGLVGIALALVSEAHAGVGVGSGPSPVIAGQVTGDTTGNAACTGCVGQIISQSIPAGSAVPMTTATAANVASVTLTAGDWDCWGNLASSLAGTTVPSLMIGAVSTTSASLPTLPNGGAYFQLTGLTVAAGSNWVFPVGRIRIQTSGSINVYLVGRLDFTTSTASLYGALECSRAR